MTREEVLEKIRQVIRDCVPEMVGSELQEDTVINTETAIDSMGFILVICKLEALFDVRIPERQWQKLSTMGDVAERLHSNKTYVSKLVNDTYNLGFPELINTLRVDYAEQYIMSHRNAKQTQIASECGFLSASAFNNTFKRITGMTPKMWIAAHQAEEN